LICKIYFRLQNYALTALFSPCEVKAPDMLQSILFFFVTGAAGFIAYRGFSRVLRNILLGKPEDIGGAPPVATLPTPIVPTEPTADEFLAAMRAVIADPGDREGRGPACARWILDYHSSDRVVELQARAYRDLVGSQ
jgi:hypothetical protein